MSSYFISFQHILMKAFTVLLFPAAVYSLSDAGFNVFIKRADRFISCVSLADAAEQNDSGLHCYWN